MILATGRQKSWANTSRRSKFKVVCLNHSTHITHSTHTPLTPSTLLSLHKEPFLITKICTSPFLRCIETANPIAGAMELPLLVENSLWEIIYTKEVLATLDERAGYFPRVDTNYKSIFKPEPDEGFPVQAMERYARAAHCIVNKFKDERGIVMCTHAAGVVSIVASLLDCSVGDVVSASPAGIFRLDRASKSSPWVLNKDCNGITSHLTELGRTTPWPANDEWSKTLYAATWNRNPTI